MRADTGGRCGGAETHPGLRAVRVRLLVGQTVLMHVPSGLPPVGGNKRAPASPLLLHYHPHAGQQSLETCPGVVVSEQLGLAVCLRDGPIVKGVFHSRVVEDVVGDLGERVAGLQGGCRVEVSAEVGRALGFVRRAPHYSRVTAAASAAV
ncbi:UNVERIFIED_CONTAM: hypothetical protein FKN15_013428 [Acipenser sinensis]